MGGGALEIQQARIAGLAFDRRNPRRMAGHEMAALRRSLEEYGAVEPAVVNADGTIIGGHMRVEAARRLGWTEFPVVRVELDDARARLLNLALNRIHGEWNETMLAEMLSQLHDEDAELALSGFGSGEIDRLLASADGESGRDTEPMEPPAEPRTQPGDLIVLDEHRLLCGDATNPRQVADLFAATTPACVLTDPPYCSGGFQEAGRSAGSIGSDAKIKAQIANDRLSTRGYMALMKAAVGASAVPVAYVFTDWRMWVNLFDVMESSGYGVRSMIVWDKGTPGMGMGWRAQHEIVMFASKAGTLDWDNHAAQGNVISSKRTGNPLHPTQKPVDLLEQILAVSRFAETVYDPFAGAGSMLIAAQNLNRQWFGMEIDPGYCDVIVDRWERHTGKEATRASRTAEQVHA